MTINSIQKHCFVVLNVKLRVRIRFQTLRLFLQLFNTAFVLKTFAYPSKKHVTYGPGL